MNALLLSLFLAQANMGLTVPTPGVTPGPTYATQISNDLVIIDAHNHTPGNGVLVPTAGLNINALLPFNGFGATGFNSCTGTACGIQVPYIGNFVADGGVFNQVSADGGFFNALQAGTGFLNTISLAGKATGTDPTITVAGDSTRNLNIVVPAASGAVIAGIGVTPTNGGPSFLGSLGFSTFSALWLGETYGSATSTNYAVAGSGAQTNIAASTSIVFNIGATQYFGLLASALQVFGIPIVQGTAATPLTLKGNAAGTNAIAVVLDNVTAQTSGTIASFDTGGVAKASVTFNGGFTSNAGAFVSGTVGQGIALIPQPAAAGNALVIAPAVVDVGGTGQIAVFQSVTGTSQFSISGRGHLIPLSTAPTAPAVGNFAAGFFTTGAVSGVTLTGSDASMLLKFTTGATTTQIMQQTSLIGTITLNQGYSSTSWNGFAAFASEPTNVSLSYGLNDTAPLIVVPLSASTFALYASIPFTPKLNTPYAISIFTMGAGSTY